MKNTVQFKQIAVLGGGTMGKTIARLFSENNIQTSLYDANPTVIDRIEAEGWRGPNLILQTDLGATVEKADLVIESVPEVLEIKLQVFRSIAPFLKSDTVVASNTSSYPLHVLSSDLPFAHRLVLMHFFNPADLIPLVEMVRSPELPDATVSNLMDLLRICGKVPVMLKKDINGFIANRLQAALINEACHLLAQDVADVSDIDAVVKYSIGLRWALHGPFEIIDLGGVDIWQNVLGNILPDLNRSSDIPVAISQLVDQHKLGVKSGEGFYNHEAAGTDQARAQREKLTVLLRTIGRP